MVATVREVAKAADVSVGTVSRVLNNSPSVSKEVNERVLDAMKRLNYHRLRQRRTAMRGVHSLAGKDVALLLVGMNRSLVNLPVVASAIHGVEAGLSEAGANLLLIDLADPRKLPAAFARQRVEGVILKGALQGDPLGGAAPELLDWLRRVPCVWFLGRPDGSVGDVVQSHDLAIGKLAADHLLAQGHENVAFLNPKPNHVSFRRREMSFTWHCQQAGARVRTFLGEAQNWPLPLDVVDDVAALRDLVDRLLKGKDRPTAVFVPGDNIAAIVYRAFSERKVVVGRDISVISCNNETVLLMGLHPALTTIDIHAETIGRRAVDLLAWRLSHRDSAGLDLAVDPTLVEGRSVARR